MFGIHSTRPINGKPVIYRLAILHPLEDQQEDERHYRVAQVRNTRAKVGWVIVSHSVHSGHSKQEQEPAWQLQKSDEQRGNDGSGCCVRTHNFRKATSL